MSYYKAVVDFSQYGDGDLSGPAHAIHDLMLVVNTAIFPSPPLTAAAFLTVVSNWDTALSESLKGGTDRTTTKNNARAALEDALYKLGGYVNLVADGDKAIVELTVAGEPGSRRSAARSNRRAPRCARHTADEQR
jgi:hypothetical protein